MLTPKSKRNLIAVGVVVVLGILLALANRWNQQRQQTVPSQVGNLLQALMQQAAQYNGAAQQDTNPLFALLHANYGLAYWTAARSMAGDEQLAELTHYNPVMLGEQLHGALQAAMSAMAQGQAQAAPAQAPQPAPQAAQGTPLFGQGTQPQGGLPLGMPQPSSQYSRANMGYSPLLNA